jgi:hypothetical protein
MQTGTRFRTGKNLPCKTPRTDPIQRRIPRGRGASQARLLDASPPVTERQG